ncbi:hydrolase, NUDIX family [Ostertagia ostertagi]
MTAFCWTTFALSILLSILRNACGHSPITIEYVETTYHGKFSNLTVAHFVGRSGEPGIWEFMDTITPRNPDGINGVHVIARLRSQGQFYFVFIKQYRIPSRSWTLEFPGGVQEADESSTEAGIRELREETGYVATKIVFSSTGRQASMPSRLNDAARHVVVEIDKEPGNNLDPQQFLDDAEMAEVVLIEESKLLATVQQLEKELDIASNVYTFALGYSMRNL